MHTTWPTLVAELTNTIGRLTVDGVAKDLEIKFLTEQVAVLAEQIPQPEPEPTTLTLVKDTDG